MTVQRREGRAAILTSLVFKAMQTWMDKERSVCNCSLGKTTHMGGGGGFFACVLQTMHSMEEKKWEAFRFLLFYFDIYQQRKSGGEFTLLKQKILQYTPEWLIRATECNPFVYLLFPWFSKK